MPPRKKQQAQDEKESFDLATVLQDDGDSERDSYADINGVAAQRLIYAISSLGGMVTFWYDNNNKRLCFSMRLFGSQRSYQIDHAAMFTDISEGVVSKLTKVMLDKKLKPPPPLTDTEKPKK